MSRGQFRFDTSAYPELSPVFRWRPFDGSKCPHARRILICETYWELRENGPADSTKNAPAVLLERLRKRGCLGADGLSVPNFSAMLAHLDDRQSARAVIDLGGLIHRRVKGRMVQHVEAVVVPDEDVPPNPWVLRAEHAERAAKLERIKNEARERSMTRPVVRRDGDEIGEEGRALLDKLKIPYTAPSEPVAVEEPVVEEPVVAEPEPAPVPVVVPEPVPVAALVESEPVEPLPASPLARLAEVEGRSMTDNVLLAMSVVHELALQVSAAEVALASPPVEVVSDDGDVKERLAVALAEAERLRKEAQKAKTQAQMANAAARAAEAALRIERETCARLEKNVEALMRGERVANDSGFKALRALSTERPRVSA